MSEALEKEELEAIAQMKNKAALAKSEAEKAVAMSRLAEVEATNLILRIYNKYSLKAGLDQIKEDGTFVRADVKAPEQPVDQSAGEVVSKE